MKYADLLQEMLEERMLQSPFIKGLNLKIESVDIEQDVLVMSMPLSQAVERSEGSGQMHGGAIASLVDTAGCFALIMGRLAPTPTVNIRVDYIRPAVKTTLIARAKVRRAGKLFGAVDIDVEDNSGKLVAMGRGTFGV